MEQLFQRQVPGTQAVERAAQLLLGVLESAQPVSVTDLARSTALPKSTASRLLAVLARHGLVAQDGPRGLLRPGPAILAHARGGLYERTLVELARPSLETLVAVAGETVNLAVPGAGGVEHLAQADGAHFLGTGHWVGRRVDYHCSAVGKVFLAHGAAPLPPEPLAAAGPAAILDRGALERELRLVAAAGHAVAIDELEAGLAAVAAPVRGGRGEVVAALSISGPTLRLGAGEIAQLLPTLKLEAQRLSRRLTDTDQGEHAA